MSSSVWQVCKCGLSNIFTDQGPIDAQCPQCHSSIAPISHPNQTAPYNLADVFSHLKKDVYSAQKPKVFGKYRPNKEVHVFMSV